MSVFDARIRLGLLVAVACSPAMFAAAANKFYVGPTGGPLAVWNSTASWSTTFGGAPATRFLSPLMSSRSPTLTASTGTSPTTSRVR